MPKLHINNNGVWQAMDAANSDNAEKLEGTSKQGVINETLSKFAPTSNTVTLQVNGGNNIAVNSRYEIAASELPASFLNADGSIKKNVEVRAELLNNSGSGVADWGETGWIWNGSTDQSFGTQAYILGDKIVVQSAATGLAASSSQTGNPWGNVSVLSSAECKVIATLAGETYTIQTP